MNIGDRLKKVREDHGLSQVDFANKIGIGSSTYSAYELDKKFPRADTIVSICKEFNVSADWLLDLEHIQTKPTYSRAINAILDLEKNYSSVVDIGKLHHMDAGHKVGEASYLIIFINDDKILKFFEAKEKYDRLKDDGTVSENIYNQILSAQIEEMGEEFKNDPIFDSTEVRVLLRAIYEVAIDPGDWIML